jgi:predicted dehydrogenase
VSALDVAKALLAAGANPDIQLKLRPPYRNYVFDRGGDQVLSTGATPLMRAAKGGDIAALKLLLEYKAKVDLPNEEGVTPLMVAAGMGHGANPTRGRYKTDADAAVAATTKAGVTLGLGYNRRFHPEMTALRQRIDSGELGVVLHFEATMTFPNALALKADAWRAQRDETPAGGLTPMGVHAIDGMIDLCGEIDTVYCQSFRRVVAVDSDDTTSMLFRMKAGMSGYLGTMTATGPGFSFQVFGSKGWVRLEGMTHVAGAPSEERRTRLFGTCKFQPAKGPAQTWEAEKLDVTRASLEAFAVAAQGGTPYGIPLDEMVHGVAVTEAVVRSAATGRVEAV